MFDTPNDALEFIKPFVPHDLSLALQALEKELDSPRWVTEGILFLLCQILETERIIDSVNKVHNHWIPDTIPYMSISDISLN